MGVLLAGMPLRDVVGGFPVSILVLLAGVTYFFGIAQVNGTIDRVIEAVLTPRACRRRPRCRSCSSPVTAAVAAMGSPQAGLVLAPLGMPVARRSGVDPVLMGIAINSGISAGGLAPTSLFGIVSYRIAREAGIDLNPLTLLAVARRANVALLLPRACARFRATSAAARRRRRLESDRGCRPAARAIRTASRRDARLHGRPGRERHRQRRRGHRA